MYFKELIEPVGALINQDYFVCGLPDKYSYRAEEVMHTLLNRMIFTLLKSPIRTVCNMFIYIKIMLRGYVMWIRNTECR